MKTRNDTLNLTIYDKYDRLQSAFYIVIKGC